MRAWDIESKLTPMPSKSNDECDNTAETDGERNDIECGSIN